MYVDAEIDTGWFNNFSDPLDLGLNRYLTRLGGDPLVFMFHGDGLDNVSHVLVQDSDDQSSWGNVMAFTIPQDKPFFGPQGVAMPPLHNLQQYLRFQLVGSGIVGSGRIRVAEDIQGQY